MKNEYFAKKCDKLQLNRNHPNAEKHTKKLFIQPLKTYLILIPKMRKTENVIVTKSAQGAGREDSNLVLFYY